MEPTIVTVFQLGQSTVVTLPKKLGIKPGTKVVLSKKTKVITLTPQKTSTTDAQTQKALAYVKKHAGVLKGPSFTPDELNRLHDEDTYDNVFS